MIWLALTSGGDELGRQFPAPGYRRIEAPPDAWNSAQGGSVTNAADLYFPIATGHWRDVDGFALFDRAEGGNALFEGSLTVAKQVDSGDTVGFAAGVLTVSMDDEPEPEPASLTLTIVLRD